jgi:hypothetical protein
MREDFDAEVADRFEVLEHVRVPDTWSRVQAKLLNAMPERHIDKSATTIDLASSGATIGYLKSPKRVVVASLVAAAALIAIVLVAIRTPEPEAPADRPLPTVTVTPTVATAPTLTSAPAGSVASTVTVAPTRATLAPAAWTTLGAENGPLAPGTYALVRPERALAAYHQLIFTLPAGWGITDGLVHKHLGQVDEMAFSTWIVTGVYDDPCHWQTSTRSEHDLAVDEIHANFHDVGTGSTVPKPPEGGLANQIGRNASALTSVELGGVSALKIELSVPAQLDLATCDEGQFRSWTGLSDRGLFNAHHSPGQIDTVYIVDVDRESLVINVSHMPATSASDLAELEAIIASMIVRY